MWAWLLPLIRKSSLPVASLTEPDVVASMLIEILLPLGVTVTAVVVLIEPLFGPIATSSVEVLLLSYPPFPKDVSSSAAAPIHVPAASWPGPGSRPDPEIGAGATSDSAG